MSGDDWVECCAGILSSIGLAMLFRWVQANPFWASVIGTTILFFIMVALPLLIFIENVAVEKDVDMKQKTKWGLVVAYLIGLFTLISSITFNIVQGLFIVLGVGSFIGAALVPLAYYFVKDRMRRNEQKRKGIMAWMRRDELENLKEQLNRGSITQEEYEEKKKALEEPET